MAYAVDGVWIDNVPTAKPDIREYLRPREVFYPEDHGGIADGVTNNDAAFAAMLAAMPAGGGVVQLVEGTYVLSTWTPTKRVKIKGRSWNNSHNAVFGDGGWGTTTNYGGSILKFTATTGIGLKVGMAGVYATGVSVEDVMILGPGSGTSIGFQFGAAANEGVVHGLVRNVLVANFAVGFFGQDLFECQLGIKTRGCSTGISVADSNNNRFTDWEVQYSTVDAILLTASRGNKFSSGLIQNCTNKGVRTASDSYANEFYAPWFENAGLITDVVDFASGVQCGIHGGVISRGNVKISATNCSIENVYCPTGTTIELATGGNGATIINSKPNGGMVFSGGTDPFIQDLDGLTVTEPSVTRMLLSQFIEATETVDPVAPAANKARLYTRDNGAGKTQICVRFPTGAIQVLSTEP